MELPATLKERIDYFRSTGRFLITPNELFQKSSWFAVFIGQFVEPTAFNPVAGARLVDSKAQIDAQVNAIAQTAQTMPLHQRFIERNCLSPLAVEK